MDPNSKRHRINYEFLFEEQGIKLTASDVEETQISTSRALEVLAKYMMIKSIFWGQQIIGKESVKKVTDFVTIPDLTSIVDRSFKELRNLAFNEVVWS